MNRYPPIFFFLKKKEACRFASTSPKQPGHHIDTLLTKGKRGALPGVVLHLPDGKVSTIIFDCVHFPPALPATLAREPPIKHKPALLCEHTAPKVISLLNRIHPQRSYRAALLRRPKRPLAKWQQSERARASVTLRHKR